MTTIDARIARAQLRTQNVNEARRALAAKKADASKISAALKAQLDEGNLTVLAEADGYFVYADGSLTPGPFGVRYTLGAADFAGERLATIDINRGSLPGSRLYANTSSTTTSDPIALRAKADLFNRAAALLTSES